MGNHRVFRVIWWATNALLALAIVGSITTGIRELSVRRYLKGFSDGIIPEASTPRQKAEAILTWMELGPPRYEAQDTSTLSPRDPTDTLNYRQLLLVCGSATNAYLNLSRSAGLESRRLLLLSADHGTKHVVAETKLEGRWVIIDAAYRVMMKDAHGNLLTRTDLQDPKLFQEATSRIPGYVQSYSYERFTHVRLAALPFQGTSVRRILDREFPKWDEHLDWNLLLERRSFAYFFLSANALIFLLLMRLGLAWLADNRLRVPRLRLRTSLWRATTSFFSTPEIK